MATNKRDVEVALKVSTPGSEKVGELAGDVKTLAGEGLTLGNALGNSADQLAALTAQTTKFRAAEAAAAADLRAAKLGVQEQKDAIDRLKASYQATGGDTAKYRQELGALRLTLVDSKAALRGQQDGLTAASIAAKNAAVSEKALGDQIKATTVHQVAASKTASDGLTSIGAQLTQIRAVAAAALGGQMLGGLAGQISQTADQYNNLAARVKLATGEGAAFGTAFQGVFDVAQRTNTAIEATGTLFTKVLQSGKALGLGVADALHLTEAINQAAQLSGASAESSNAALIQLVQGLQSGVLRGDEFNSVMEQAPRLAQALADGLGVTTGELRKMAEAGKLTSATVIASLQGQSAVLQSEFEKLPATVGRAITNLSTSWTQYVGEVDKANGISAIAAGVINALARNLDTLGAVLIGAGKAAIAYKAIELAQLFFSQAASITAATAATAANTTATVANTAAKQANATAGDGATASVGKFAGAIASIKLFALVAVLTNLREIGTAIGEGVAKWAGYGKSIEQVEAAAKAEEETTRANTVAKAALAQQMQIAADRALGLTAESKKLKDEFEGLRLKGESTAEALEKLTKSLRIGDIKGIADAGAALDALGVKGELSATQISESWAQALKDIDLGVFTTEAGAAFDTSEQGARRLAEAMDGALREAIRRSGVDFQLISGGMGKASQSALNDLATVIAGLDKLKASGAETGQLLAASIGKAIAGADSQKAIESVRLQIEGIRRVLGDKIADGFLDQANQKAVELKDSLDKALPGVNSIREAYKQLGLQAPEDIARVATANKTAWDLIKADGAAGADVLKAAFARYAQSALDASGAAGTAGRETTRAMLEAEAAARGLGVEFDNTGRVIVRGAFEAAGAVGKTGEAFRQTTEDVKAHADAMDRLMMKYTMSANYTERQIALLEREAAAQEKAAEAERKRLSIDKNGFSTDKSGNTINAQGETLTSIVNTLKGYGLDDAKAAELAKQYINPNGTMNYGAGNSLGGSTLSDTLRILAEQNKVSGGTMGMPPGAKTTPAPAGGNYTVNVNLNGGTTPIHTTTQADADILARLLSQLGSAKGTAA